MENASKALLMAATVLVGVLLLSLGTYLFTIFSNFSADTTLKMNQKNIDEFNAQFYKYKSYKDESGNWQNKCRAQDIVSIANIAKENNIIPIVSAPCVEVWFLVHYRYSTAQYSSNDEVIEELKKHCAGYNKSYDIYPLICNNTNKAIINAKRLEKFQLENGRILQMVETNPYTEVYKIIEEIQKN